MLDLLLKRRSVRKYKDIQIEKDKIDTIIKAALLSPTSRGLCLWEFIIVDDKDLINKLAKSKEHGSQFLTNSPLAIVVMSDSEKCDVWIEDTSIASIIIQLAGESIGLSSCWIQIRNRMHDKSNTSNDYIKKLLNISEKYSVLSIIAIGYHDEEKTPYKIDKLDLNKIHHNYFDKKYF